MHNYYQDKVNETRLKIINDNSEKIFEITQNKINELLFSFKNKQETEDVKLTVNKQLVEICSSHNCIKYDLFDHVKIIDWSIPNYINYKISFDDTPIESGAILESYTFNKIYNFEKIKFVCELNIDSTYWRNLKIEIRKPFWEMLQFIIPCLVALFFIFRISTYKMRIALSDYFQKMSKIEIDEITSNHTASSDNIIDSLKKKIWSLEAANQKAQSVDYIASANSPIPSRDI